MFEFLTATGIVGALSVGVVFVAVFLLAERGKEISFWGIKFQKQYKSIDIRRFRKLPKPLPEEWKIVLQAFVNYDDNHIHEDKLFNETRRLADLTELKTREICSQMEKYGLLRWVANYVQLNDRSLSLLKSIEPME